MPFVKTILYGNFLDVITKNGDEWVNGELVPSTNSIQGKAIVMPWNTANDYKIMESGGYNSDDRKAYTNEPLHDITKEYSQFQATIGNTEYMVKYIMKHNEGSVYVYGLKRIVGGRA